MIEWKAGIKLNLRNNLYRNHSQKEKKKVPIDWDSFVVPSERGKNVDEYMREILNQIVSLMK